MGDFLQIMRTSEAKSLVENYLETTASDFALSFKGEINLKLAVASQLKYLQKARKKLPTWFENRCLIPPVAYEQCTAEAVALLKDYPGGKLCLDLTSGLGVDSWRLSHFYDRVISLEPNEELAEIVRHNLSLLKVTNVEVLSEKAEDFLARTSEHFDLIVADPSRRDQDGNRSFLLEDCQPDVLSLQARIQELSEAWVLKASPLFDLEAGFSQLKGCRKAKVISLKGECKEVEFQMEESGQEEIVAVVGGDSPSAQFRISRGAEVETNFVSGDPTGFRFALEPDVAFYKAGITSQYLAEEFPDLAGAWTRSGGYFLSKELPENFSGKIWELGEVREYRPGPIKKWLKQKGISQAEIGRKGFDLPIKTVRKQLRLNEGNDARLLLSQDVRGKRWVWLTGEMSVGWK